MAQFHESQISKFQFDSEKFHLRNGNWNLFFMEQQIFHYSKLEFDSENEIAIWAFHHPKLKISISIY